MPDPTNLHELRAAIIDMRENGQRPGHGTVAVAASTLGAWAGLIETLTTVTDSDRRPTALLDTDRANFDTLRRAMENDDVALMHVREKATGHGHALLCIMSNPQDESDDVDVIPVARMLDEDPTETYTNPAEG